MTYYFVTTNVGPWSLKYAQLYFSVPQNYIPSMEARGIPKAHTPRGKIQNIQNGVVRTLASKEILILYN